MMNVSKVQPLPAPIADFYAAIDDKNEFNYSQVISILDRDDFKLSIDHQREEHYTEEQYSKFHKHCFKTPLLAICHIASQHNTKMTDEQLLSILQRLIKHGSDIHARDDGGDTPIFLLSHSYAYRAHLKKSIEYLVANGANINGKNKEGLTVLDRASSVSNYDLAAILLCLGARVSLEVIAKIDDVRLTALWVVNETRLDRLSIRHRTNYPFNLFYNQWRSEYHVPPRHKIDLMPQEKRQNLLESLCKRI